MFGTALGIAIVTLALDVEPVAPLPAPPVDATPLAEAQIDVVRGLNAGTQEYTIHMRARESGGNGAMNNMEAGFTMSTRLEHGKVVLDDTVKIRGMEMHTVFVCEPDSLLSLREGRLAMTRRGKSQEGTVTRNGTTLTVNDGSPNPQEIEYPAGTLLQSGLLRIVPMLPRTPGAAYTFTTYCENDGIRPRSAPEEQPFRVECLGPRTETVNGKEVVTTGYRVESGRQWACFVDGANRLCLIVADQGDTRMELIDGAANARTAQEPTDPNPGE